MVLDLNQLSTFVGTHKVSVKNPKCNEWILTFGTAGYKERERTVERHRRKFGQVSARSKEFMSLYPRKRIKCGEILRANLRLNSLQWRWNATNAETEGFSWLLFLSHSNNHFMTGYSHVLLSKGCFYKRRYHRPNSSCSNQTSVILCGAKKYLTSAISFCLRKRKRKKETGNLKSCNVMKLKTKTVYNVLGFSHGLHSSLCEINNTTALQF